MSDQDASAVSISSKISPSDFREIPTAILSDNLDRLRGTAGLRPYVTGVRMFGRAMTVKTREGDNLVIHQALAEAQPGTVVVVDGSGNTSRALVGEIMMEVAKSRGVCGFVIDGAIRDAEAFQEGSFPCFARGATHKGPYKDGPGYINVAVSIDGNVVQPGDFVVGDADGVIFFAPDDAEQLFRKATAQIQREQTMIQRIRAGQYNNEYAQIRK